MVQNTGVFTFCLVNVLGATAPCNFSTSQLQKMVRSRCVLYILICKCASRYSNFKKVLRTRQFFNILNFDFQMCFWLQRRAIFPHPKFKKRAVPVSFLHFDLQMCFSLQRPAIFRHRNFKKWSENVFYTF